MPLYTYLLNAYPKYFFNSRNIKYVIHGCMSKRKESNKYHHYIEMILTDRDASLLRMFDAFIESAPQLVLQIYLILREQENLKNCENIEVHNRKFLLSSLLKLCIVMVKMAESKHEITNLCIESYKIFDHFITQ